MSHWIKDLNNNLGPFLLHTFFIPFILHSYGSFVFCQLWVIPSYLQGIFYHSTSWPISVVKLKSLASSHWQFVRTKVRGNVFLYATSSLHNKNWAFTITSRQVMSQSRPLAMVQQVGLSVLSLFRSLSGTTPIKPIALHDFTPSALLFSTLSLIASRYTCGR